MVYDSWYDKCSKTGGIYAFMKFNEIFGVVTAFLGGLIGFVWGEFTPLLAALIALMSIDYISGVTAAIVKKELSSEIGFKGILKKLFILLLIGVTHILDFYVIKSAPVLQSAICMFFIANEGISIIENSAALGIPIPQKLISVLAQLKRKGDDEDTKKGEDN